ncbi:hypothetical protein [Gephyromycinifex aptenodytis]|uniref:hypothetical protein n=1 Tax=Gephyromycinifex aptenodytis TaxID=2716227 RepID=UPI001447F4EE|nr:hypothetical protein [Gephyromycinifex aptenodytis]
MPELPASVRLSLWGTRYLLAPHVAHGDAQAALGRAVPDADEVCGGVRQLSLWRELGERSLLVALPAPGDLTGLPRGAADFTAAALEAGECVYAPGLGGALVPRVETFGPPGDEGLSVTWEPFECAPPDPHMVQAIAARDARRQLRIALVEAAEAAEALDLAPMNDAPRQLIDARLEDGRWGLPDDVDPDAAEVLRQAAVLETIAATAIEHLHDADTAARAQRRSQVLREIRRAARSALATATCAAALSSARRAGQSKTSW